jgi:hypothetical protein
MQLNRILFYLGVSLLLCCAPKPEQQHKVDKAEILASSDISHPIKLDFNHAKVTFIDIMAMPYFPVEINVVVWVELRDNCTEIHEIYQNQEENIFLIELLLNYSDPPQCPPRPTISEYIIPLDIIGLKSGNYTVYVNQKSTDFYLTMDNM